MTGISIRSKSEQGNVKWKSGVDSLHYPCSEGLLSFEIEDCKDCAVIVNGRKKIYGTNPSIMDTIQFTMGLDSNKIEFYGGKFVLLDLIEKNSNPGIVYHSTGVAGATFQSYVQNPLFEKEIGLINTDLIIISIGTNESMQTWNQTSEDVQFAYRMAKNTNGRVFFPGGGELDRYVVWDYLAQRRTIIG